MTALSGALIFAGSTGRLSLLWRYRELVWMLAWRDIRVRYKHSLLGAAWAIAPPLLTTLIFTFVFGTVVDIEKAKLTGSERIPYALFALAGLVPWTFFANGLSSAVTSMTANRPLVTKIYFPREVFPISAILGAVIDFAVSGLALISLGAWFHVHGEWTFRLHAALLFIPIIALVQLTFMLGLSLLLSMANLFYRDVGLLFRSLIQLWMFGTCVVYNLEPSAFWKRALIQLNPMTPIIRAYRDCLFGDRHPMDAAFGVAALISLGTLAIGWWWFRRREFQFAEHV